MSSGSRSVLIVDDDEDVRSALRDVLGDSGFAVTEAANGAQARELLVFSEPDVVLLDLGLPDVSGLDMLTEFTSSRDTPVIVVSGRAGESDTVVGLNLGADDYITKPFSGRELVARINASMRRSRRQPTAAQSFGPLTINEATRDVTVDGRRIDLTPKEFDLLWFLARSPRRVFDRGQILVGVWASSPEWQADSTVVEHVHRLRRKLDADNRSRWIETVRGVGYRFTSPAD